MSNMENQQPMDSKSNKYGFLVKSHCRGKGSSSYKPLSKDELIHILLDRIKNEGEECDLNDIDVSGITDMSYLFNANSPLRNFKGNISEWDVSNVIDMEGMFMGSCFNGDISSWDVGSVTNMKRMFMDSEFDGDLSGWNVSNVQDKELIFADSPIGAKLPRW